MIRLGDTDVEYHPGFQLYMTTPLANPHYLPEVCIKVTLVNFTVTRPGLEEQLLAELVRKERPDLQASRDRLLLSISNDKRQLKVWSSSPLVSLYWSWRPCALFSPMMLCCVAWYVVKWVVQCSRDMSSMCMVAQKDGALFCLIKGFVQLHIRCFAYMSVWGNF